MTTTLASLTDEQLTKDVGQQLGAVIDAAAKARGDARPLAFVLLVCDREGRVHRVANVPDAGIMGMLAPVLEDLVAEHVETVGKPVKALES